MRSQDYWQKDFLDSTVPLPELRLPWRSKLRPSFRSRLDLGVSSVASLFVVIVVLFHDVVQTFSLHDFFGPSLLILTLQSSLWTAAAAAAETLMHIHFFFGVKFSSAFLSFLQKKRHNSHAPLWKEPVQVDLIVLTHRYPKRNEGFIPQICLDSTGSFRDHI